MSEQLIEPGQKWRRNGGEAVYVISEYDPEWDDCTVNVICDGKTYRRKIFGSHLRKRYTLLAEVTVETGA